MSGAGDTIVALSSGGLPAAIAVIRASGPAAAALAARLAGRVPPPRRAVFRTLRDAAGEELDRGLVLFFPGPGSATGEDVAEFHVHGSRAVVAAMLRAATALPGVRLAEPGEFTRRAFLNGRLDLTETEGLADLIAAETEAERRRAVRQAGGALRLAAEGWRERLIALSAAVEAGLDFADEEDVAEATHEAARAGIAALAEDISAALARSAAAPRLEGGLCVAIVGAPNVGKSSLLNALAEREVAIVTEHAGTTRDVVEARLDLSGYPVVLSDTAGLREAADPVERIGVARALAAAAGADLVLLLAEADATEPPALPEGQTRQADGPGAGPPAPVLTVATKSDLGAGPWAARAAHRVSVTTGEGLAALVAALTEHAREALGPAVDALVTRERQRSELAAAAEALAAAAAPGLPPELAAEHLRHAGHRLGRLTGAIDVEDLLDALFSRFCIGK